MTPAEQLASNKKSNDAIPYLIDLLSLWEAMDAACGQEGVRSLIELRENVGTAELRDLAISLHPYTDKVWKAYEEAYGDFGDAFDWEFLPLLVSNIDWSLAGYNHTPEYHLTVPVPSPKDMARRIKADHDPVDLGARIQTAIDADDSGGIDGDRIAAVYAGSPRETQRAIDDVMISLCGWSLSTLLTKDPAR